MLKKIKNKIKSIFHKKVQSEKNINIPSGENSDEKHASKKSKELRQKKSEGKNSTPRKNVPKKKASSKKRGSKKSVYEKHTSKKHTIKRSKKVTDPEAKQEAQRYDNPVASRSLILQTIKDAGMMTQSSVFKTLVVREDQEEGVSRRLSAMVRDGQLVRNRRGGYLPVDEKHFVRGHVIAHADGFGFMVPDEGGDDLFLSAKQMRGVLHGDHVVATVTGVDRRGRSEGSIISVIERANSTLIGRLFDDGGIAYVVPDNKRITQNIMIPADMFADASVGQIVKVEITCQPTKKRQMVGKIIDVVGDHMAAGMEIEIAIHNHGIPFEFLDEVTNQANKLGGTVKDKDKLGRLDLRNLALVTIDGEDARDFDDAVYCEPNKNGWKLIVAIADVAHYVGVGSPLDVEAYERATSVYFPGRVVPMLPEALSNGLCSINPDVDRLCMICEMFINKQGEIESYDFKEAVMRSHARLTYTQVSDALKANSTGEISANVYPHIENLNNMYQALDGARRQRGTIEFDTTETVIHFTDDKRIDSIRPSVRNDAHKIIEECMISANVCAAKFIAKNKLPCLYRVHEDPSDEKIDDLRGFLSDLDLKLGAPSRKIVSSDYAELSAQIKQRDDYHMIQTLMLRSMKQAIYKAENSGHFGLALTHYAHFTSPIRRYPDLLVHRALKHIVRKRKKADYEYSLERMVQMGEHCSNNERRANEATRDAEFALKCEYMLDKIGKSYDAHITGVVGFGLFVELSEHYVEGLIHITNLPKDYYVFDPKTHQLVGENRGIKFGLNDKVRIRVARVDMDERKIDFELLTDD
ncbi:3'-to-5' exoribonuclease RNase R [hydrothermal vent metagenome]|uniref:exoribonuclease II n=1 Tax=hydrothermal vent metagenome TaxID=652676 RepID=A0A3B0WQC8_9ZZZZ